MKRLNPALILLMMIGSVYTLFSLHQAVILGRVESIFDYGIVVYKVGFFEISYQADSDILSGTLNLIPITVLLMIINNIAIYFRKIILAKKN